MKEEERKAVHYICRGFRAALPVRRLLDGCASLYGHQGWSKAIVQQAVIQRTINYRGLKRGEWSGDASYDAKFLRLYLKEAEECLAKDGELDEELVSLAAETCQGKSTDTGAVVVGVGDTMIRWVEYEIGEGRRGLFRVSKVISDVAQRIWEAGLRMCDAIMESNGCVRSDINGKMVLEIGAGSVGLSAFAMERAGVKRAVLTDRVNDVRMLEENLRRNGLQVGDIEGDKQFSVNTLNVENSIDWNKFRHLHFNTILAADVTYDPSLMKGAIRTFHGALTMQNDCSVGYLFATRRSTSMHDALVNELHLSEYNFSIEDITKEVLIIPTSFDYLKPALLQPFDHVCVYRITI